MNSIVNQRIEQALSNGSKKLDLSRLELAELPDLIGELSSLEYLNVCHNQLTKLPDSLCGLTKLTGLNVSGNRLTTLPRDFPHLRNLRMLYFSMNYPANLKFLETISRIKSLELLDISHNQIRELPRVMETMDNLKLLDISYNFLVYLPDFLFSLELWWLNCCDNSLTEIPQQIYQLYPSLRSVDFSWNHLTELPRELSILTALQELMLGHNKLTNISDYFYFERWRDLEKLDLSSNRLEKFPECIGKFGNLIELDLSHNLLSSIPESIGKLNKLSRLMLSRNQFTTLPDSIGNLCNLEVLDVASNQLGDLPKSLSRLLIESPNLLFIFRDNLTSLVKNCPFLLHRDFVET